MAKYAPLLIILACIAVYANTLTNDFISDDIDTFIKNPPTQPLVSYLLNPINFLNAFNYSFGKLNPVSYHLINLGLHILCCLLVYCFLRRLFTPLASTWGALIFSVHPIHTEAVTWISGRPYLVICLASLTVYLLYCRSLEATRTPRQRRAYYCCALSIFAYFLISQYSFFALTPLLLIASDVGFEKIKSRWRYWLPFIVIVAVRLTMLNNVFSSRVASVAIDTQEKITNPLFCAAYSILTHAGLLLWPQRLSFYQDQPSLFLIPAQRWGLILLIIFALTLTRTFRRSRRLFLAFSLFLIFLAPTFSPAPISSLIAERYLYIPSIGLCVVVGIISEAGRKQNRIAARAVILCLALIFLLFAARAITRNTDWKNTLIFWEKTVAASPRSPSAHNNLAGVYQRQGDIARAIKELESALSLNPSHAKAQNNLGFLYNQIGRYDEAIDVLNKALAINPYLGESYFNLAVAYLRKGECSAAWPAARRAEELQYELPTEFRRALKGCGK